MVRLGGGLGDGAGMKTNGLRHADVRDLLRLVGEVRDLGVDELAWRRHACGRLAGLLGATVGMSIQARFAPGGPIVAAMVDLGWQSEAQRQVYHRWLGCPAFGTDPGMAHLARRGNATFLFARRDAIADRDWYAAAGVSEFRRAAGVDDCLLSSVSVPGGGVDQICLHRPWGARHRPWRGAALLTLFHGELQRLWAAEAARRSPADRLPAYLRRSLDALTTPATEREIAAQLGVTPSTLHTYAKQVYARLGVGTRRDLVARFAPRDFTPRLTPGTAYRQPWELVRRPGRAAESPSEHETEDTPDPARRRPG